MRRKLGQVMSLTLTAEQANVILEAEEPQTASIYVALRRNKVIE